MRKLTHSLRPVFRALSMVAGLSLLGSVAACTNPEPTIVDAPDAALPAAPSSDAATPEILVPSRPADDLTTDEAPVVVAPPADVVVVITTDNAFSFGYGDAQSIETFMQGVPSGGPEIFDCPVDFGPESYLVPGESAPDGAYLYIVAWADPDWTQGALAQFKRVGSSTPIYSGDGTWQVCATGQPFDGFGQGPDQATVNAYLSQCNLGSAGTTYSKGWVDANGAVTPGALGKLANGEANDDPAGDFALVCQKDDAGVSGIDAAARWMWFDPEDGMSAFRGNADNRTRAFLIFRLPADVVVLF